MYLPDKFCDEMKRILGDEYEDYLASMDASRKYGLRVNTAKISVEDFLKITPFELTPIPYISNGFYYDEKEQPSKHPYYFAGLYYLQDPSAMTPASRLPVEEGDVVLDLCAAPGGKATELGAKLHGTGLLIANDISSKRAKALLKNIELFGVENSFIVTEYPAKLTEYFTGFFDKILIDAPCSGEGMFRKSPAIMKNWEQYGVEYYHKLQLEILDAVLPMLAPGGMLVYSTCTFSPEEDEGSLQYILENYPDMHVIKPELNYEGFSYGHPEWIENGREEIANSIRLWPHKLNGEGHFVALLQKDDTGERKYYPANNKRVKLPEEVKEFLGRLAIDLPEERLEIREDRLYLLPENIPDLKGLRIMRSGLLLGEIKKNRFEPSQALACALRMEEYDAVYNMDIEDEDVIRYLKCETIEAKTEMPDGFVLVCAGGFPLGWAKSQRGTLKNKYLPGWRMM